MLSGTALVVRWLLRPVRLLFGFDVFISYARKDGERHLNELRERLPRAISVRCDLQGAGNEATLTWRLYTAILLSRVLAIVGTAAAATSVHVAAEVRFFRDFNDGPAIPIEAGWPVSEAEWRKLAAGPAPVRLEEAAGRILDCVGFWRRGRRLQLAASITAVILAVLGFQVWRTSERASAVGLAERARTMADVTELGIPNLEKAYVALESWRKQPNAAALQLISKAVEPLSATIIAKWDTGTGDYVRRLALDPAGEWIAACVKDAIALGPIDRGTATAEIQLEPGTTVQGMSLTGNNDLLVLSRTERDEANSSSVRTGAAFRRFRAVDASASRWEEVDRIDLAGDSNSLLSGDGAWIATPGENTTRLIATRPDHAAKNVVGRALCFENGVLNSLLAVRTDRKSQKAFFVNHYLNSDLSALSGFDSASLQTATREWLKPEQRYICTAGVISDGAQVIFTGPVEQPTQKIPWGSSEMTFSQSALLAGPKIDVSHLYGSPRNGLPIRVLAFLPSSTALAFGPKDRMAISDGEETRVYIVRVRDERLLWDSSVEHIPAAELAKFKGLEGVFGYPQAIPANGPWKFNGVDVVDGESNYPVLTFEGLPPTDQGSPTWSYAFRRDGKAFLIRDTYPSPDGRVLIWSLDPSHYVEALCRALSNAPVMYASYWNQERHRQVCGGKG
jgi:hypothetical protein